MKLRVLDVAARSDLSVLLLARMRCLSDVLTGDHGPARSLAASDRLAVDTVSEPLLEALLGAQGDEALLELS